MKHLSYWIGGLKKKKKSQYFRAVVFFVCSGSICHTDRARVSCVVCMLRSPRWLSESLYTGRCRGSGAVSCVRLHQATTSRVPRVCRLTVWLPARRGGGRNQAVTRVMQHREHVGRKQSPKSLWGDLIYGRQEVTLQFPRDVSTLWDGARGLQCKTHEHLTCSKKWWCKSTLTLPAVTKQQFGSLG